MKHKRYDPNFCFQGSETKFYLQGEVTNSYFCPKSTMGGVKISFTNNFHAAESDFCDFRPIFITQKIMFILNIFLEFFICTIFKSLITGFQNHRLLS